MKILLSFAIACLLSTRLFSQDTLYTREGNVINGKVTEITREEIKYKKASNPEGPSYVVSKSDIVLIHYKNGSKEIFQLQNNPASQLNSPANPSAVPFNAQNPNDDAYAAQNQGYGVSNVNVVLGGGGWGGWGGYLGGYGGYGCGGYGGYGYGGYGSYYGGWGLGWGWGGRGYYGGYGHRGYYGGYRGGCRGSYGGYRGGHYGGGGGFHGGGGGFHGGGGGHGGGGHHR